MASVTVIQTDETANQRHWPVWHVRSIGSDLVANNVSLLSQAGRRADRCGRSTPSAPCPKHLRFFNRQRWWRWRGISDESEFTQGPLSPEATASRLNASVNLRPDTLTSLLQKLAIMASRKLGAILNHLPKATADHGRAVRCMGRSAKGALGLRRGYER